MSVNLATADVELKAMRQRKLEVEIRSAAGDLLSKADARAQEIVMASAFRATAREFLKRVRMAVELRVSEPAIVARILADLETVNAELLRRADPLRTLDGLPAEQLRAVLVQRVEEWLNENFPVPSACD